MQLKAGRHFAHEHPASSTAWNLPEMKQVILQHEVDTVTTHMCSFGMTASEDKGIGLVKKPTKIMSSSAEIIKRICKTCNGNHRHVHLVLGRAKAAQVYSRLFCSKLCEGIAAQKKLDDLGMMSGPVMSMEEMRATAKSDSGEDPSQALHERYGSDIEAFDDLTGDVLDAAMMAEARKEEIMLQEHGRVREGLSRRQERLRSLSAGWT